MLKKEFDKPLILTAHGHDIYELPFKNNKFRKKTQFILKSANQIITVSKRNSNFIRKLNITNHVSVIPNGYDSRLFYKMDRCKSDLNIYTKKKILLTIGNLVDVKGQKYLINSIKEIVKFRQDFLLLIIGSGILKDELTELIRLLDLDKFILMLGGKSHNEIPLWMNACDIFVMSSLNEGCPTTMIEALGCGKPFVGTNVGGIPEIIINNKLGSLVEPANSNQLAREILLALDREWDTPFILNYSRNLVGIISSRVF